MTERDRLLEITAPPLDRGEIFPDAGGYVIVDDYDFTEECRAAVHDYLDSTGEAVELKTPDTEAVYWRRER